MSLHECECGKVCRSAAGLASHQRSCRDHLDADLVGAQQLNLLPADDAGRGHVEAAAVADLTKTWAARGESITDAITEAVEC